MNYRKAMLPVILAAQLFSAQASAHSPFVGECFTVRGKLFQSNGNPSLRLRKIGTKRIFGVFDCNYHDESDQALPEDVKKLVGSNVANSVLGEFEVCPLTKRRPGWMQMVCIKNASHLVKIGSQ